MEAASEIPQHNAPQRTLGQVLMVQGLLSSLCHSSVPRELKNRDRASS